VGNSLWNRLRTCRKVRSRIRNDETHINTGLQLREQPEVQHVFWEPGLQWKSQTFFNGYFWAGFMSRNLRPDRRLAQNSWGWLHKSPSPAMGGHFPARCAYTIATPWRLLRQWRCQLEAVVICHNPQKDPLQFTARPEKKHTALFKPSIHERCWSRNVVFSQHFE
jgi:hypothetical protein